MKWLNFVQPATNKKINKKKGSERYAPDYAEMAAITKEIIN